MQFPPEFLDLVPRGWRSVRARALCLLALASSVTVVACSEDDPAPGSSGIDLGPDGPFPCGPALSCGTGEMCVQGRVVTLMSGPEDTYACAPVPPGCESRFCDCPATEVEGGEYDGREIIGCSAWDERTLTLALVPCGTTSCVAGSYCQVEHDANSQLLSEVCQPRPAACDAMCEPGCGGFGELFGAGTVQGCGTYHVDVVVP